MALVDPAANTRNDTYRRAATREKKKSLDSCKTVQTFSEPPEPGRTPGFRGVQSYLQEVPNTLPVDGVVAVAL